MDFWDTLLGHYCWDPAETVLGTLCFATKLSHETVFSVFSVLSVSVSVVSVSVVSACQC